MIIPVAGSEMSRSLLQMGDKPVVEVDELPWRGVDASIRSHWERIVNVGEYNPSLRPDWVAAAAEAFGVLAELRVLVVREGGQTVGVVPFFVRQARMLGVTLKVVELAGNLVSYHQEITAPGYEQAVVRALLKRGGGRDCVVQALNLVEGGPTDLAFGRTGFERRNTVLSYPGEVSPYLPVVSSWDEFVKSRDGRFRYKVRKVDRILAQSPDMSLRWFDGPSGLADLMEAILRIEGHSWKVERGMDIRSRPVERVYHERLVPMLAEQGMLFSTVLYVGGVPAAYSLACRWKAWVGQLKTSFDETYADRWPGRIVMLATIRRTFEEGAREFDFLGDAMQHKLEWTAARRQHVTDILFGAGLKSRLVGWVKKMARVARGGWARYGGGLRIAGQPGNARRGE